MRKFEFGLMALCVLVGCYYGSLFGMAVAICVCMIVAGLVEMAMTKLRQRYNNRKKEVM